LVDDASSLLAVVSKLHVAPVPAENSWAEYSALWAVIDPDQVKLIVAGPVDVTTPYQISMSLA
jgi:hypothetical protein